MIKKIFLFLIFSLSLNCSSKKTSRDFFDKENNDISSQANFTPIKKLRSLSQVDLLTPQTAEKINQSLNDLKSTPGESQKIVAKQVAVWAFHKIVPETIKTPEKNQALLQAYQEKTSPAEVLKTATKVANNQENFVATNTKHVLYPTFEYDNNNEIKAIHGGHALENYTLDVINSPCILDQNESTIGIFVGKNNIGKTVKKNITEQEIIKNQRESRYIGKHGDLDILENNEKELFGVYSSKNHSMIDASQFPLMFADLSKKNSNGKVTLFTVGKYDKKNKNITSKKNILALSYEIQELLSEGKQITENLYSVRKAIEKHFKPDLITNGFPEGKLPGNFYLKK